MGRATRSWKARGGLPGKGRDAKKPAGQAGGPSSDFASNAIDPEIPVHPR
jgi:hypothetical protein